MISRRQAIVGLVVLLVAGAAIFEGATTIHLTYANNFSVVHARPGQVLQVRLETATGPVFSSDAAVVRPLAIVGSEPITTYFITASPGKAVLHGNSNLALRCLALLCGWRVEVDVG